MPENIWFLLVKKLTKEASVAELRELEHWLLEHPDDKQMADKLVEHWETPLPGNLDPNLLFSRHLSRLKKVDPTFGASLPMPDNDIPALPKPGFFRKYSRKVISTAAILIVVLATAFWVLNPDILHKRGETKEPGQIVNEIQTRHGSRSKIVLPDGSKVWVNANSQLLYKPGFGISHRRVQLNGEAYFDVAKNKELPFEIETRRIKVKVTGTVFNVRAYDDEEKAETSLFEGSVQVSQRVFPDKNYYLKPNQKLIIDESKLVEQEARVSGKTTKKVTNTTALDNIPEPILTHISYDPRDSMVLETSWLFSTLAFNNESFLEIANKMEKWYGVEIFFESKKLEEMRFTGRFTRETIQEALEALQFTAKFKFRKEDNRIIIY